MRVRVQIFDDRMCQLHDGSIHVSDMVAGEAREFIDFPAKDCDAMTAYAFCTPPKVRGHIREMRGQLSSAISEELMRFFESKDTEMGYPKESS